MSKFLYLKTWEVPESPSINYLSRFVEPVLDSTPCLDALERFFSERRLYALPVVDAEKRPVGLIERHVFVEFFGQLYTKEIHGKKPVSEMKLPVVNHKPVIVSAETTVDDVAQIISDAGMAHMVSGFIISSDGRYLGVANGHDLLDEITQRRQAELYALAHYDQLTGLPNRRLFLDRIDRSCREAKRSGQCVAAMFIDVDRFKQVNDNLGHAAGDHLLRAVAERLRICARDSDTVARLGGDEFGIVMDGVRAAQNAQDLAVRIVESMREPIIVMDRELFITVSIGIALYPTDDTEVPGLLTKADVAMYDVKASGRNGYKAYLPGLEPASLESMSLEAELRHAVANDQLLLHYQPQVSLATGRVRSVEALVRWEHPRRGLLSPAHFIPIAEQSRLIVDLGYWVLRAACLQHGRWMADNMQPMTVSVNVSTLQFQQQDFCERVREILAETGMNPAFLELEVTESIMMHHGSKTLETLRRLKDLGVSLALDDFGTGFSSLSYLRQFPIDRLKIDQSFVREIERSESGRSIVRAISALGKSLSMEVIAEGIETGDELQAIQECSCDGVQGYFFSRPLPPRELAARLAENEAAREGPA